MTLSLTPRLSLCGVALFALLAFLLARKQCGQHLQNSLPKVCSHLHLLLLLLLLAPFLAKLVRHFYCLFVLYFLRTIWAAYGPRIADWELRRLYASMARRALDNGVPAYCLHWLFSLPFPPHTYIRLLLPSFCLSHKGGDCALGFSIICRQLSNANAKLAKIIYCIFNSARAVSLAKIVAPNQVEFCKNKKRIQQQRERERETERLSYWNVYLLYTHKKAEKTNVVTLFLGFLYVRVQRFCLNLGNI